jgi:enoyl-CoA hydratase/carnithine racemase
MSNDLLYEKSDRVARITLNRPETMNALTGGMCETLWDIVSELNQDPDVWVVVITGSGPGFCSGHDLKEFGGGRVSAGRTDNLFQMIQEVWKPTIASINGICVAQGAGIALSCDLRIASENARIGWPQVKWGISSVSAPCILAQMVPFNYAMELLYTGELITAQQAFELRLLNKVVPHDLLEKETESLIGRILANAPLPMRLMKEAAVKGRGMSVPDRVRFAQLANRTIRDSADSKEGIQAFFERRAPVWEGR